MNAIVNQTQLICYCEICDETVIVESKSKFINSKTHKHKQKSATVLKEYDSNNAVVVEMNHLLSDTVEDCKQRIFIHLNIDVYMISNLQIIGRTKKLFYQIQLTIRNSNLNFMD